MYSQIFPNACLASHFIPSQISIDAKSSTISFTFTSTTIVGHVANPSPVKTSKGNIKRKYFTFDIIRKGPFVSRIKIIC